MILLTTIFTLTFTVLVQDVGPVTTDTDYQTLALCEQARVAKMKTAGDRMIHGHCKQKTDQ